MSSDATCNLTGPGDRNSVDPLLGPLANNGGFTPTHALLPGSPAIDAVRVNLCPPPATDQRGVSRPQGTFCDSGAFERQASPQETATVVAAQATGTALVLTQTAVAFTPTPTPTRTPTFTATSTLTPTATATSTLTPSPTRTATHTATTTPTATPVRLTVPQAVALVQPSGQAGPSCADAVGQACQVAGAARGTGTVTASMSWNLTATVPVGVVAGSVPVAVVPTTAGLQGFPCAAVGAGAPTVSCVGVTAASALQGSVVTVVFGPGLTAVGAITGPGPGPRPAVGAGGAVGPLGAVPLVPPPPILLPPPPPPPIVPLPAPPLAVAPPRAALAPELPLIPEADSLLLLGGGLAVLAALTALRRRPRR